MRKRSDPQVAQILADFNSHASQSAESAKSVDRELSVRLRELRVSVVHPHRHDLMNAPPDQPRPHRLKTRATGKLVRLPRPIERFQLLVECSDERDQRSLYEQLVAGGRKCRVITI